MSERESCLLIHHRDITSPFSATVPHYVSTKLAASREVHVICTERGDTESRAQRSEGVVYHDISAGQVPILSAVLFLCVSAVYAAVLGRKHRYDAVYGFQRTLIQAWVGAALAHAKFVAGLQVVPVRQKRDFVAARDDDLSAVERLSVALRIQYARVVRWCLRESDEVVCLTEGIRRVTEREYGLDLSAATVIGMGVETAVFDDERGEGGCSTWDEPLTVTYVGSLGTARGLAHVIEALADCPRDFEFHVAGSGTAEYVAAMQRRAAELGVADRVVWHGRIPHEDVPAVLADADVAISPLENTESYRISFPAKLLEYMAAGSVVVASDIPPHRRLISDGQNGVLYDGSATDLCDTLERCVGNPETMADIESRATETAREYDWDSVVEDHAAVLFGGKDRP